MTYQSYGHDARSSNSKKRKHTSDDVKRENKRLKNKDTPENLHYVLPPRHRKRFKEQKKSNHANHEYQPHHQHYHHANPLFIPSNYSQPQQHQAQPQQPNPYGNPFYPPSAPAPALHPINYPVNYYNPNMSNSNLSPVNPVNVIPHKEESLLKEHDFEISSSASNPSNSTDIQINSNLNNTPTNIDTNNQQMQCIDSRQLEYDLLCRTNRNAFVYDIYYGEYFVSIDVECGATGYGHFDSAPVRISMVDFYGNILFDRICCIPNLMDPLSEFTGLNLREIEQYGDPLTDVLSEFHEILASYNKLYKYGVVLVGQSVIMDIIWTKLQHGVHYSRIIDIAHQFRTKEEKWSKFQYYSLRQVAWALLQRNMKVQYHDSTEDAHVTMQLYREFCLNEHILNSAKEKLKSCKKRNQFPNFRVYTKFPQCCAMYAPNKCFCGQTSAADLSSYDDIEKLRKLFSEHAKNPVCHI